MARLLSTLFLPTDPHLAATQSCYLPVRHCSASHSLLPVVVQSNMTKLGWRSCSQNSKHTACTFLCGFCDRQPCHCQLFFPWARKRCSVRARCVLRGCCAILTLLRTHPRILVVLSAPRCCRAIANRRRSVRVAHARESHTARKVHPQILKVDKLTPKILKVEKFTPKILEAEKFTPDF